MKLLRKAALGLAVLGFTALAGAGLGAAPAMAAGQICAQGGTGYCLNDWNGGGIGASIKMGQNGWPHQAFGTVHLTGMCGNGGFVAANCPNSTASTYLFGEPIVAIKYSGGGCLGSGNSDDRAFLVTCPDNNGNGGGWGSIQIQDGTCSGNSAVILANSHFTGLDGRVVEVVSGGAVGAQALVDSTSGSCWGTG